MPLHPVFAWTSWIGKICLFFTKSRQCQNAYQAFRFRFISSLFQCSKTDLIDGRFSCVAAIGLTYLLVNIIQEKTRIYLPKQDGGKEITCVTTITYKLTSKSSQVVQLRVLLEFCSIWNLFGAPKVKFCGNSWGTLTSYMPSWTRCSGAVRASVFCHKKIEACKL